MKDKVQEEILRYQMIRQGDRVVAALSGGADSMALLAFLRELAGSMGFGLEACHVNHGLRGEESDRDEAFVRDWCAREGIPCRVIRLDGEALRREKGGSLEEAARAARYRALEEAAGPEGKIATGHTASDNLETVLLNLARGTGLRGLCGIPPVRGRIIRPLLSLTREQVEAYCAQKGIPYVTDSTNLEDNYSRNRLRHQAVPALLSINPAAREGVAAMCRRLRGEEELLERLARETFGRLEGEQNRLNREELLRVDPGLRPRVLGILFDRAGVKRSSRLLELLEEKLEGGGGVQIGPGCRIQAAGRWVELLTDEEPPVFQIPAELPAPGQKKEIFTPLGTVILENSTNPVQNSEKINNCPLKNVLDYDRIEAEFAVRSRLPGDSLRLPGRGITKSLKKLSQEAGISPRRRDRLVVLCDREGVLWLEGFGVHERVAVSRESRRFLTVRICREEDED